jgi:hypothetical protein
MNLTFKELIEFYNAYTDKIKILDKMGCPLIRDEEIRYTVITQKIEDIFQKNFTNIDSPISNFKDLTP